MSGIRWFFLASLTLVLIGMAALVFTAPAASLPDAAAAGQRVWRAQNCESCHTVYGLGGAYAPDLTRIYGQRGEVYLRDFLVNPQAYHPGQRVMPAFGLTRTETDALLAYLQWIGEQPNAVDFPVRPINVNGGGNIASSGLAGAAVTSGSGGVPADPVEAGRYWFSRAPANCSTCHSLEPGAVVVGPSLSGVASRAGSRISGLSAEAYLRQSILTPGAYVVSGFPDAMARNLGDVLDSDQLNQIIAFLLTLD
ncbi:MAG: c-type cytochrome [Anaerolineae bacterium]